jgi:hypothetical protein
MLTDEIIQWLPLLPCCSLHDAVRFSLQNVGMLLLTSLQEQLVLQSCFAIRWAVSETVRAHSMQY